MISITEILIACYVSEVWIRTIILIIEITKYNLTILCLGISKLNALNTQFCTVAAVFIMVVE